MQKKVDLSGITKLYKSTISSIQIISTIVGFHNQHSYNNHPILVVGPIVDFFFPSCCTLKYIPTAYTSIIDVTLNWVNFIEFYELFVSMKS
jgi:hypothetical protein